MAVTEIVRTISPPSRFYEADAAPPLAENDIYAEAITQELAEKEQQTLI